VATRLRNAAPRPGAAGPVGTRPVGARQALGSLVFTAFFLLWTFCYAIFFVIACLFLPFRGRFALARVWGRVILAVLRWTCRLDYRVEGEHLPAGNHIVLMKHSSSWETAAQAVLLPPQVWVLKRELTWIPFVGWGIRQLHAIAVRRGSGGPAAVRDVIEQGTRRLAEGAWIVVFPEGTRMAPGQTRKYGSSGAMLAAATGKLIVPVAHDSGYYWPRRGLLKKPGTIRVVIGPPVEAAGRSPRDVNAQVQQWIEEHSRHAP